MTKLSLHQSTKFTKLLLVGDSGSGKTGAIVSLIAAGYKVRILDLDNGIDIIRNLVLTQCPEAIDNVDFITVTDKFKQVGGKAIPVDSTVWSRAMEYLMRWTNENRVLKVPGPDGKMVNYTVKKDSPEFFDLGVPAE